MYLCYRLRPAVFINEILFLSSVFKGQWCGFLTLRRWQKQTLQFYTLLLWSHTIQCILKNRINRRILQTHNGFFWPNLILNIIMVCQIITYWPKKTVRKVLMWHYRVCNAFRTYTLVFTLCGRNIHLLWIALRLTMAAVHWLDVWTRSTSPELKNSCMT